MAGLGAASFRFGLAVILHRGLPILAAPFLARAFGPAEYGRIDLYLLWATILAAIAPFELGQGLGRHLGLATDEQERRRLTGTAVSAHLLLLALLTPLILLASTVLDLPVLLAALLAGSMACEAVLNALRWWLADRMYLLVTVVHALVAGLGLGLVLTGQAGWQAVLAVFALAGLAGAVTGLLALGQRARPAWAVADLRRMLAYAVPLVPALLGSLVVGYCDRLIVAACLDAESIGSYLAAARLASGLGLLLAGLQLALPPWILTHHRQPWLPPVLAKLFLLTALGCAVVVVVGHLAGQVLAIRLLGPSFAATGPLLGPCLLAAAALRLQAFAPGPAIAGRPWRTTIVLLAGGAALLLAELLLIPYAGARGAAWAAGLIAVAVLAALLRTSQPLFPVPHRWTILVGLVVVVLGLLAIVPG